MSYTIFITTCAITNFVHNLHTHTRNYHFRASSSYPRSQLPVSCTIFIPTCTFASFVYNLHTHMHNYHIRFNRQPTCAITKLVYNLHTHLRNYQFRVQSSHPLAHVQASYSHAQLPISCTIFIPPSAMTNFVYNLHST